MKRAFKILILAALTGLILVQAFVFYLGYERLMDFVALLVHETGRMDKLQEKLPPPVIYAATGLLTLLSVLLVLTYRRRDRVYGVLAGTAAAFRTSLNSRIQAYLVGERMWILLVLPTAAIIFYGITQPVSYDEAWTYLQFSSKSVLSSISYYPAPNNHVLHSVLTNISILLPFDPLLSMRIPAMIIYLLSAFLFYCLVREYGTRQAAVTATALYTTFFFSIHYGYLSRGYALLFLFTIWMLYALFKIRQSPSNRFYWLWYVAASVGGFFTMPSFLYPFLSAQLILLPVVFHHFWRYTRNHLALVFAVLFLYTPIMIVNWPQALFYNPIVQPISRLEVLQRSPGFWMDTLRDTTGLDPLLVFVLLIVASVVWFMSRRGVQRYGLLLFTWSAPILVVLHSVIAFSRTFAYLSIPFAILLGQLLYSAVGDRLSLRYWIVMALVVQAALICNFDKRIIDFEGFSIDTDKAIDRMEDGKTFFTDSYLLDNYLHFRFALTGKQDYTIERVYHVPMSADTIDPGRYDFRVIEHPYDSTRQTVPLFSNRFYSVY